MFRKIMIVLLFLILSSVAVNALDIESTKENMDAAQQLIMDFLEGVDKQDTSIITGSKISIEEKIVFNMVKDEVPELKGIGVIPDKLVSGDDKNIVLIGGERTNVLSKALITEDKIITTNISNFPPFVIKYGLLDNDKKYIIIFSEKEIKNNPNYGILKSPLSRFVDPKFVPVISVSLSILLLYLWSIFGKTLINLFTDFVSSKILNKASAGKTIKKKKVHEIKPHEFVNLLEIITFIITVILFALAMSWSWSNSMEEFWSLFLLNLVVVGAITFFRELLRLISCYRQKLRSEYVLWPMGSIITIVSTFLGNTFSLASYTLLDEDEADLKRFGKSTFIINLLTFIIGIGAYIINIFSPSIMLQMIFVYSMMILFIEMFPLSPMAGYDVKKWSVPIWLIFYIVIIVSYFFTNFTVYV